MTVFNRAKKLYPLLAAKLRYGNYSIFLLASIAFSWILVTIGVYTAFFADSSKKQVLGAGIAVAKNAFETPIIEVTVGPSHTPTAVPLTLTPTPTLKIAPTNSQSTPAHTPTPAPHTTNNDQYTAEKIDDVTWRVKNVSNDSSMASPQDIVNALNSYRGERGKSNLIVDINLATYAQERANLFSSQANLDSHAGFRDYMNNGGFEKSGFNSLGENSAMLSGPMNGEKIIRSIFGADPSHDGNQLDTWTHVGVGVSGNFVNVNFGREKR